jgi:hypothetical protein
MDALDELSVTESLFQARSDVDQERFGNGGRDIFGRHSGALSCESYA